MANPSTHPQGKDREPFDTESDSARSFLEALERDRGTVLLSESEYQEMRHLVLVELARGPSLKPSTLVTFGVVGLILFVFFILGLVVLARGTSSDWPLAAATGGCIGMWAFMVWQYVTGIRQQSRLSLKERLAEVEELRQCRLITQEEYEHIYGSIHLSRGVPLEPEK